MLHLVFNQADVKLLQEAMSSDSSMEGEVILIRDDFSLGPIANIYTEDGINSRKDWWKEVYTAGDPKHNEMFDDDNEKMLSLKKTLLQNEEEQVWIWAAQNNHDVSGYYWTLYFLKEFQGRIFILYLNNLPFINEKGGIFYPNRLDEIPAREFLKAKKLARLITLSEFEVDPDEWMNLCNEDKGVRLLEGGKKIVQADYEFYDTELRRFVMPDWQKVPRIIHNFLNKAKNTTGEAYLIWRLKKLLASEKFDAQGNQDKIKDLELKTKSATPAVNA